MAESNIWRWLVCGLFLLVLAELLDCLQQLIKISGWKSSYFIIVYNWFLNRYLLLLNEFIIYVVYFLVFDYNNSFFGVVHYSLKTGFYLYLRCKIFLSLVIIINSGYNNTYKDQAWREIKEIQRFLNESMNVFLQTQSRTQKND